MSEAVISGAGGLPSTGTEEGRAFLQQRMALFFRVVFLLCGGFWVIGNTIMALSPAVPADWQQRSNLAHLGTSLLLGALWLVAARGRWSAPGLGRLDIASAIVVSAGYSAMLDPGHHPASFNPILLATLITLLSRAIIVPSSALRTAVLTSLASIVPAATGFWLALHQPAELRAQALLEATFGVVWLVLGVILATVASRTLYGLREEVREARRLGRYTLEEKLGEGGMGQVYRARHAMLRRPTAIKLLPPGKAGEASLRRFEREVQLTSELTHPNTIAIHDYGRTPDGVFYYVMEYLDGVDLERLVAADGAQPGGRVRQLLVQVCGALAEAHGVGLIHRDIKPANIIISERGGVPDVAKVVDFGLVKNLDAGADPLVSQADTLTGTPLYMAPEMIREPEAADARSDLYSLGAVAYFLLSGAPMFAGTSLVEVCSHHLHTEPEPLAGRTPGPIAADLAALVHACLAKQPADRPASAVVLRGELLRGRDADWDDARARDWWRRWRMRTAPRPAAAGRVDTIDVEVGDRLSRG